MTQTKKMKTFKNLCLTLGLMLSVVACSKEAKDAPQTLEPSTRSEEGKSIHVGSRDSIVVNFTIGADSEELRLAQSVNAEGVPFNPFMEEKDVVIRFAVRKSNRVTYTDAICKKIPGENQVTYKGIIHLPDLGYGNTTPTDLTGHEIAGILLGEANNGTQFVEQVDANTVKSIEQTELLTAENDVVRSKIPYLLDWTTFPLTSQGLQTSKLILHFKPVGNLLRIQFHNQLNEAKTLQSIKLTTNAFVTQCMFNLRSLHQSISFDRTTSGSPMVEIEDNFKLEKTYRLITPIRIEAKTKSKWYYLWVMPIKWPTSSILNQEVQTKIIGKTDDGNEYDIFNLCNALSEGTNKLTMSFSEASTVQTAFKGGQLPLSYLAEYDVAPNGVSFVNRHTLAPLGKANDTFFGYFLKSQLSSINIPGYSIPDMYDMGIVAPAGISINRTIRSSSTPLYDYNASTSIQSQIRETGVQARELIRFPGEAEPVVRKFTYLSPEPGVVYALRFYGCDNNQLTAYRYKYHHQNTTEARLVVSSMFLGSGFTGDIHTISNSSFWESSPYTNTLVSRIIPMLEDTYDSYSKMHDTRTTTNIRRTHRWKNDDKLLLTFSNQFIENRVEDLNTTNTYAPVRLIKNEYKTAR